MAHSDCTDLSAFMEGVRTRNPHQDEFVQAVCEVASDVFDYIQGKDEYTDHQVLLRMSEPDRIISFRVSWEDDNGDIQIERGWRVQNNNAIGPYKGGLRFHPSVNESVLKFLAFEQTFKNALTGLPMGGGKGGSNFNPKGRSDREIMRFCQSFMTELYRHIGPNVDVPAGDIGVGSREIGYLFGQYKRITNEFEGVVTGKGLAYGGSMIRPEATGWGAVYFLREMLRERDDDIDGKTAVISGAGNVATHAAEKFAELGGKVLTLSDSDGFVHDPDGIDAEKIAWVRQHTENGGRMRAYPDEFSSASYHDGEAPWNVDCDIAMPCATQNELDDDAAKALLDNDVIAVCEGANMPATQDAAKRLRESGIMYAPGKAANAGGVAVSGLEMSQNAERRSWEREELQDMLCSIMTDIHARCVENAPDAKDGGAIDYVKGANVAGFRKVAEAMLAFGVV
ncbi:NADP-specific glutamate dehydrogenase [Qipengyuania atrilutea]|uniref:Glutamate dehydrogenase n=1 Tax=Qipengyuania atrilutea TaxID=2744473 RepID=A0A850H0P1_9SPHN|nr:NADP-specific glutamate dehydrogenase [Actirhodobacter atriluteus]NVD44090.1 NADP-specific glutamate dehydrogenase [Actirhodobacter atriluteus]